MNPRRGKVHRLLLAIPKTLSEVKWIEASNNISNHILKKDLLTTEDVDGLIEDYAGVDETKPLAALPRLRVEARVGHAPVLCPLGRRRQR
jgi:hypothetical protein